MIGAIARCSFVEKHIALPGQKTGFDIQFSLRGNEIKNFINLMHNTHQLISNKKFVRNESEKANKFLENQFLLLKI